MNSSILTALLLVTCFGSLAQDSLNSIIGTWAFESLISVFPNSTDTSDRVLLNKLAFRTDSTFQFEDRFGTWSMNGEELSISKVQFRTRSYFGGTTYRIRRADSNKLVLTSYMDSKKQHALNYVFKRLSFEAEAVPEDRSEVFHFWPKKVDSLLYRNLFGSVKILGVNNQVVKEGTENPINLSDLKSGLYYLEYRDERYELWKK